MNAMIEAIQYVSRETRREWHEKDRRGKLGVILANVAMASRAALLLPLVAKPQHEPWTWKDMAFAAGMFGSDFIDGKAARTLNGETTAGAILDPIFDKAATTALEIILTARGELAPHHIVDRGKRDLESTSNRTHALLRGKKPNATRASQVTTALRMAGDLANMSPIAQRRPELVATFQEYVTRRLIESGNFNRRYYRSVES